MLQMPSYLLPSEARHVVQQDSGDDGRHALLNSIIVLTVWQVRLQSSDKMYCLKRTCVFANNFPTYFFKMMYTSLIKSKQETHQ